MWNEVGSVGVEKGEEEEEACRRERAKGARVVFCPMTGLRVLKTDLDMLVIMEKKRREEDRNAFRYRNKEMD